MSQHNLFQASSGVEEKFFKTMKDLTHHYKKKNQGLATRLSHSLKRKTLQDQPYCNVQKLLVPMRKMTMKVSVDCYNLRH